MRSQMEIAKCPPTFTFEHEAKCTVVTERSFAGFIAMANGKLELEITTKEKVHWYQTTMADLLTILESADEKLSQSRKMKLDDYKY